MSSALHLELSKSFSLHPLGALSTVLLVIFASTELPSLQLQLRLIGRESLKMSASTMVALMFLVVWVVRLLFRS